MNLEEIYHYSVQDNEADYRHQRMIEEWQYADHFKQQDNDHLREATGTERTSSGNEVGCMGVE